ncbi:hypothetical protein Droror1_Dr00022517, partial [Drosera rotundifolia]
IPKYRAFNIISLPRCILHVPFISCCQSFSEEIATLGTTIANLSSGFHFYWFRK